MAGTAKGTGGGKASAPAGGKGGAAPSKGGAAPVKGTGGGKGGSK